MASDPWISQVASGSFLPWVALHLKLHVHVSFNLTVYDTASDKNPKKTKTHFAYAALHFNATVRLPLVSLNENTVLSKRWTYESIQL